MAERALPLLMRPGLRLVFVGYNPGIESARQGHYYAFGGNVFWGQLNASGLVARTVGATDDHLLMDEAGIGFTDLCTHATVRASELTAAEIAAGAARLFEELDLNRPETAVFSGRGIYTLFGRHALGLTPRQLKDRAYGLQPEPLPASGDQPATRFWVIPSSSGLASRWHRERLELLRALAAELGEPRV